MQVIWIIYSPMDWLKRVHCIGFACADGMAF